MGLSETRDKTIDRARSAQSSYLTFCGERQQDFFCGFGKVEVVGYRALWGGKRRGARDRNLNHLNFSHPVLVRPVCVTRQISEHHQEASHLNLRYSSIDLIPPVIFSEFVPCSFFSTRRSLHYIPAGQKLPGHLHHRDHSPSRVFQDASRPVNPPISVDPSACRA